MSLAAAAIVVIFHLTVHARHAQYGAHADVSFSDSDARKSS